MKFITISNDEKGQIEKMGDMPLSEAHNIIEILLYQEAFGAGRKSIEEEKEKSDAEGKLE